MDRLRPLLGDVQGCGLPGSTDKRRRLNNGHGERKFGALIDGLKAEDLRCPEIKSALKEILDDRGGLLILRGLKGLSSQQLVDFTAAFGDVETHLPPTPVPMHVPGAAGGAVMRIGNTKEPAGGFNASFIRYSAVEDVAPGEPGFLEAIQYDAQTRTPLWHTDQVFFQTPPAGSVLYCITAPPVGADTCFADTTAAFEALPSERRGRLEGLEAICSLAHHDAKVHRNTPSFPLLSEEKRQKNPPVVVPIVLKHPRTGRKALYAVNQGTCFVREAGDLPPTADELRRAENEEAWEHPSVDQELRSLLPHATSPSFTVRWRWSEGDIVVWDNRSTMHCGTSFDAAKYTRELWRTTYHDREHAFARPLQGPAAEAA